MTEAGQSIGGYEVIRRLGDGGMGEVFLVRNPQLNRLEALKVVSIDGRAHPEVAARFEREAQAAAALAHPNIVTIFRYGIDQDQQRPWYTMTYLDGADLSGASLNVRETLVVVEKVADALDYAHRQGMIHRDVKPANVMVSRRSDGELDRVVLVDFGIAKLAELTDLTATNGFVGTLNYTAPEIFAGGAASPASDQYSLACTVFELLTGRPPFPSTSLAGAVGAHVNQPVPEIASLRPELWGVDPVLRRALAKNPAERFATCLELLRALRSVLTSADGWGREDPTVRTAPAPSAVESGATWPPMARPTAAHYGPPAPVPQYTTVPQFDGSPFLMASSPKQKSRKKLGVMIAVVVLLLAGGGVTAWSLWPTSAETADESPLAAKNMLTVGTFNACAVVDHTAYCMGKNQSGAGGAGSGKYSGESKATRVVDLDNVSAVSTGSGLGNPDGTMSVATCAIAAGKPYCWGEVSDLLERKYEDALVPKLVPGLTGATSISTNTLVACAIADAALYCWGRSPGIFQSPVPTQIPSLRAVTDVDVSSRTSCAVAGEKLFCWGGNESGQVLGREPGDESASPMEIRGLDDVRQVTVGARSLMKVVDGNQILTPFHNVCAVVRTSAFCWGDNLMGQIGNGTTEPVSVPTEVPGLTGVTQISSDVGTTCAVADGDLYCWGNNKYGQLGDGTREDKSTPQRVAGLPGSVVAVEVGKSAVCARTDGESAWPGAGDGAVYCWGVDQVKLCNFNDERTECLTSPVITKPKRVEFAHS
ncbi:protein kinase domain-containing protein [Gordonia phthalatica]|uniref:protein kinase domain-containing protein n=1 Tax=Gordonia phthalatica TaxID=1136941 RepID=UPI000782CB3E|nr:protein kinase [Gordonia phthalatica]